jgi:multiple sugar transport system substrate-binding protein
MSRLSDRIRPVLRTGAAAGALAGALMMASGPAVQAAGVLNGETIRILVVTDPVFKAMQEMLPDLEAESGGKIELTVLPFDQLHQQVLLNAQAGESKYDIIGIDLPQFGEYKPFLTDLTPYIEADKYDITDFHAAAWEGMIHEGKVLGIPIQPQPEIFGYRTDLFEAAGLQPPKTTDEVLAAAKKLHNPDKNIAGICWNGARGTPLGQTFLQVLGAYGQAPIALDKKGDDYDIGNIKPENMKPMLDTPVAVDVAKYLVALLDYSPPGILNMAWDERTRVFTQGGCAMTYIWSGSAAEYEGKADAPAHGKVAYVPHPAGNGAPNRSTLGGWSIGIPTALPDERKKLAWEVIKWLTTKEKMAEYTKHGDCISPRKSVSADPDVIARCPVIKAVDEFANKNEINSWQRPPVPELQQVVDVLGAEMHEMLSGKKTPEEATAESQRLVDRIMQKAGYY